MASSCRRLETLGNGAPLSSIATFNVKRYESQEDAAARHLGLVTAITRLLLADGSIVCLQEVSLPLYKELERRFAISPVPPTLAHQFKEDDTCAISCVLMQRRFLEQGGSLRYVALDKKVVVADVVLPPPQPPADVKGKRKKQQQVATVMRIANVHLPADKPSDDRLVAHGRRRDVLTAVLQEHKPDVVAGDFNFDSDEQFPLSDTTTPEWRDCTEGSGSTWENSRLDRVYARCSLFVPEVQIVSSTMDTHGASDHVAVILEISHVPPPPPAAAAASSVPPSAVGAPLPGSHSVAGYFTVKVKSSPDEASGMFTLLFKRHTQEQGKLDIEMEAPQGVKLSAAVLSFKQSEILKVEKEVTVTCDAGLEDNLKEIALTVSIGGKTRHEEKLSLIQSLS